MKMNWTSVLQIFFALAISGFVWTQDNQLAVLTLAAMVIVWGIQFAGNKWNWHPGKTWLTVILLGVSVLFSILFQPVTLPALPIYSGDVIAFVGAILIYAGGLLALGSKVFALATGLYNILLAKVTEDLSAALLNKFPVLRAG